jgi:hypothetical protein
MNEVIRKLLDNERDGLCHTLTNLSIAKRVIDEEIKVVTDRIKNIDVILLNDENNALQV